jgi:hypothetical protein
VTIAKRPSFRVRDGRDKRLIWGNREAKYFFERDWTDEISLESFDNFSFTRDVKCQEICRSRPMIPRILRLSAAAKKTSRADVQKLRRAPTRWDSLDWRWLGTGQPAIDACTQVGQSGLFQESVTFLSGRQSVSCLSSAFSFIGKTLTKRDFVFYHGLSLAGQATCQGQESS